MSSGEGKGEKTVEEPAPSVTSSARADGTEVLARAPVAGTGGARDSIQRFTITILDGPSAGLTRESSEGGCSIGSHLLNDVVLEDPTVSGFHCEIRIEPEEGVRVVDLKSRNGTVVDGVRVREGFLRAGSILQLGRVRVRYDEATEVEALPPAQATRFGSLVGVSRAMRAAIALYERAATSDVTVLIQGETGTGKGRAAEAIHRASARHDGPFIFVDCSAVPANLLESEFFGHEKGAFTGAEARRVGAFEEATGGTLFLDEIGELPLDLQPKLLHAIENREIRRVGANRYLPVDLRLVAATNRDLRAEVNAGRFRSDLYYRLAVLKVTMPSLRERPEDIAAVAAELLDQLAVPRAAAEALLDPSFIGELQRQPWPGNVRELRNHLEARLVLEPPPPPKPESGPVPYSEARSRCLESFEREYLEDLMRRFPGKAAQAAQAAGLDRVYLYRLLKRRGIKLS
jgi:DNA-binding NtrC family response regulator